MLWYSNIARLIVTGVIPLGSLAYLNFGIYSVVSIFTRVIDLGSDTFGNPIFQKVLKKLAIILGYKRPWMICLALLPRVVFDLKLPQNHFNKKCSSKILFLKKKNQKDLDDF